MKVKFIFFERCLLSLILILFSLFWTKAYGQQTLHGKIIDSLTNQPIAFAYITLSDNRTGTSTDIEGKFSLVLPENYSGLIYFSHVSYQKKILPLSSLKRTSTISLLAIATELQEVAVIATREENPAFRIIRQAIAHKKDHDPDRLKSYEYISYNKFLATLSEPKKPLDSILKKMKSKDTVKLLKNKKALIKFDSLAKTTHFFLSESVTEKQKINPVLNTNSTATETQHHNLVPPV